MQALSELAKSAEFLVVEKMTYIDDGNAPFRAAAGAAVFGEHFGIGRRSHAHAGATGTERQAREAAEIAG